VFCSSPPYRTNSSTGVWVNIGNSTNAVTHMVLFLMLRLYSPAARQHSVTIGPDKSSPKRTNSPNTTNTNNKKPGRMRCKPSSVPPLRRAVTMEAKTIYLDPLSQTGSPGKPGSGLPAALGLNHAMAAAWPCTRWGLPCRTTHAARGALLPHHFTLTDPAFDGGSWAGGIFSVALSLSGRTTGKPGSPGRWALPTTAVQWCSDFPPPSPEGDRSGLPRIRRVHYMGRRPICLSANAQLRKLHTASEPPKVPH